MSIRLQYLDVLWKDSEEILYSELLLKLLWIYSFEPFVPSSDYTEMCSYISLNVW
jgi:hypothetical protein